MDAKETRQEETHHKVEIAVGGRAACFVREYLKTPISREGRAGSVVGFSRLVLSGVPIPSVWSHY